MARRSPAGLVRGRRRPRVRRLRPDHPQCAPPAPAPAPGAANPSAITLDAKPVQGPCTSVDTFGQARGGDRAHLGTDIGAAEGNEVYAVTAGEVVKVYTDAPGSLAGNGAALPPRRRHGDLLRPPARRWLPGIASARRSPPVRSSGTSATPATPAGRTSTWRSTPPAARPSTRTRSSRRSAPAERYPSWPRTAPAWKSALCTLT